MSFWVAAAERDGEMEKRCRSGTLAYVLFLALGAAVTKAIAEGTTATCDPYNYCKFDEPAFSSRK